MQAVNAHSAELGASAQYSTLDEYFEAIQGYDFPLVATRAVGPRVDSLAGAGDGLHAIQRLASSVDPFAAA